MDDSYCSARIEAAVSLMRSFLKKALDAASEESRFSDALSPHDWSRDGKWIAYGGADVMVASAIDPAKRFAFLGDTL